MRPYRGKDPMKGCRWKGGEKDSISEGPLGLVEFLALVPNRYGKTRDGEEP